MKSALAFLLLGSVAYAAPLGDKPIIKRSEAMITTFDRPLATQQKGREGVGGATGQSLFPECTDMTATAPVAHTRRVDQASGLAVEVTTVTPGVSYRNMHGFVCAFRVSDPQNDKLYVDVPAPPFETIGGMIRVGDVLYTQLEWNGYAKEAHNAGNYAVAFDLATHKQLWKSPEMTSNAELLVDGDWLVTGYGFTKEPHFLVVIDRKTGAITKKVTLPKSPDGLYLAPGELVVHLYDGFARFTWTP